MAILADGRRLPHAVIFDLDEALLDTRKAWKYTLEETLLVVRGERIDVSGLVEEYRRRTWAEALAILLNDYDERRRGAELCERMWERTAMKRLLVHDGVGMALDGLRERRVEMGAISRLPHATALKQVQSTGLDRFLDVLSATPEGERWAPGQRFDECAGYLDHDRDKSAFVGIDLADLRTVGGDGVRVFRAAWAGAQEACEFPAPESPAALIAALRQAWGPRRPS